MMPGNLTLIKEITDEQGKVIYKDPSLLLNRVLSESTAGEVTSMLQLAVNSGTGSRLRSQFGITVDVAGKTGTAQNFSDAWFLAYTPELVIGTWVGAMSPGVHFHSGLGSGSSLALPICGEILRNIEKDRTLAQKYLRPFRLEGIAGNIDCDPFGRKSFFDIFKRSVTKEESNKKKMTEEARTRQKEGKQKKGIKEFFRKLFGKKNKKR